MKKVVMKKWYENRTKRGYWSTVKQDFEQKAMNDNEYLEFINNLWSDDKITRGYTRLGYLPTRITNISPSENERVVYEFLVID